MAEVTERKPTEIKIPVPWGHIAGKIWGKLSGQRILAVHGKQDNCGVFDRLIPLLQGNYQIVAIDLPGHGLSSHFPFNVPIDYLNYVMAILYVVKEIQWGRFHFLGHSLGGQIGLFFAAIYPEYVEKLIIIDHISPVYVDGKKVLTRIRNTLEEFITLHARLQKGNPPIYTYQEALEKLTNRESALTTEAAKIVLKRSLQEKDNGYTFCMDQRLKLNLFPTLTSHVVKDVIQSLKCSTLFIFSTERHKFYQQIFKDVYKYLEEKPNIILKVVGGNHDVHQNHPERIVKIIEEFVMLEVCKL